MNKIAYFKFLISGFFAGILIGIGGLIYILCMNYPFGNLIGAFLFSFSLYLICRLNLFLYTGKIGFITSRQFTITQLCIILIGNLLGASLIGILSYWLFLGDACYLSNITYLLSTKLLNTFIDGFILFIRALFCGILVHMAVFLFTKSSDGVDKFLSILIPIFIFVFCGFRHCIADMYYFMAGCDFTWSAIFGLILTILGNSIGAFIINLVLNRLA